jgi:hypothetical protein
MRDPVGGGFHGCRVDPAAMNAAVFLAGQKAGVFQDAQMLGYGGKRHRKGVGEVGDRSLPEGQPRQDRPPGRVRERGEGRVETLAIVNHSVKYLAAPPLMSSSLFHGVLEGPFSHSLLGLPRMTHRIFLLSPASCSGERARMLLRGQAQFMLARRVRRPEGAPLGELFSFLSGLYFRGKHRYAETFACAPEGLPGVFVITAGEGLVAAREGANIARLRRWARVSIDADDPRYHRPLSRDAKELAARAGAETEFVLLGSIASRKYVDVLVQVFKERLVFPREFVGRGDMSRGGLLLRCAREGRELEYVPVAGAVRHGPRPPKLPAISRRA